MSRDIVFDEANDEWQIVDEQRQVLAIFTFHCEAEAALAIHNARNTPVSTDMSYIVQSTAKDVRERLERVFTDVDCVYMDLREGSTEANQIGDALNHLEQAIDILKKMEREP